MKDKYFAYFFNKLINTYPYLLKNTGIINITLFITLVIRSKDKTTRKGSNLMRELIQTEY